MELKEKLE
ncbi:hypothetical protein BC937DRAFT_87066, partial [Endogone sp. FLAS-F59071]